MKKIFTGLSSLPAPFLWLRESLKYLKKIIKKELNDKYMVMILILKSDKYMTMMITFKKTNDFGDDDGYSERIRKN